MKTLISSSSIFHTFFAISSVFGCLVGSCIDTVVAPAQAADVVSIDFSTLPSGTPVTQQFANQGIRFGLTGPEGDPSFTSPVAVQLSSLYTSSGVGLTSGNSDVHLFRDIEILFDQSIDFFSILALDAEEAVTVRGFSQGEEVATSEYRGGSNTEIYLAQLGQVGGTQRFDRIVLDLVEGQPTDYSGGPEFFSNLQFHIPEANTACVAPQ